jgi:hypothetical protein
LDQYEIGEILILLFNCTDPELFIDFFAAIITFLWIGVEILCSMNGDGEDNEQQSFEDTKNTETITAATGGNNGDDDNDSPNKSNKRKLEEDNEEDTEEIPEESKSKKQKLDESLSPTPKDTHVDEPALPTSVDIGDRPQPSLPPTAMDVDNDADGLLPPVTGENNADEVLSSASRDSSSDPAPSPISITQFDTAGDMDRDDLLNLLRIRNESQAQGDSWDPSPEDANFILMQIELANDDHSDIGFDENTPIEVILERRITDVAWRINNPEIGETSTREHSEAESSDMPSSENQNNPNPELSDSPTDSEPERRRPGRGPGRGGYPTFTRYRGYPRDNNSDDSED